MSLFGIEVKTKTVDNPSRSSDDVSPPPEVEWDMLHPDRELGDYAQHW